MIKTKIIVLGRKAYMKPVSYCLKVNSNNICANSFFNGNHKQVDFGEEFESLDDREITTP